MKRSSRAIIVALCLLLSAALPTVAIAHSGRTDSNGGHYNHSTGEYHYHHGYPAHQHDNGICPYSSAYSNESVGSSSWAGYSANNSGSIISSMDRSDPNKAGGALYDKSVALTEYNQQKQEQEKGDNEESRPKGGEITWLQNGNGIDPKKPPIMNADDSENPNSQTNSLRHEHVSQTIKSILKICALIICVGLFFFFYGLPLLALLSTPFWALAHNIKEKRTKKREMVLQSRLQAALKKENAERILSSPPVITASTQELIADYKNLQSIHVNEIEGLRADAETVKNKALCEIEDEVYARLFHVACDMEVDASELRARYLAIRGQLEFLLRQKTAIVLAGAPPYTFIDNNGLIQDKRGIKYSEYVFYANTKSKKYHTENCLHRKTYNCKLHFTMLKGFSPCKVCNPQIPDISWILTYMEIEKLIRLFSIEVQDNMRCPEIPDDVFQKKYAWIKKKNMRK